MPEPPPNTQAQIQVQTDQSPPRGRIAELVNTAKEAAELALDATKTIGSRSPATILVWGDKLLIGVLGVAIAAGVWLKLQQDREAGAQASRDRAEIREDSRRNQDNAERRQVANEVRDETRLSQIITIADRAVEAQRESSRVLLMAKGAVDETRDQIKKIQAVQNDMAKERQDENRKLRETLDEILKCLKGKCWNPEADIPPPRPRGV